MPLAQACSRCCPPPRQCRPCPPRMKWSPHPRSLPRGLTCTCTTPQTSPLRPLSRKQGPPLPANPCSTPGRPPARPCTSHSSSRSSAASSQAPCRSPPGPPTWILTSSQPPSSWQRPPRPRPRLLACRAACPAASCLQGVPCPSEGPLQDPGPLQGPGRACHWAGGLPCRSGSPQCRARLQRRPPIQPSLAACCKCAHRLCHPGLLQFQGDHAALQQARTWRPGAWSARLAASAERRVAVALICRLAPAGAVPAHGGWQAAEAAIRGPPGHAGCHPLGAYSHFWPCSTSAQSAQPIWSWCWACTSAAAWPTFRTSVYAEQAARAQPGHADPLHAQVYPMHQLSGSGMSQHKGCASCSSDGSIASAVHCRCMHQRKVSHDAVAVSDATRQLPQTRSPSGACLPQRSAQHHCPLSPLVP